MIWSYDIGMRFGSIRKGKYFIANSPYIQDLAQKKLHRKIPCVPNSMDEERFLVSVSEKRHPHYRIISINNGFSRLKNVTCLIRAFRALRERLPQFRLTLVGLDYEAGGKAHVWAKKHGYETGIEFAGPQSYDIIFRLLDESDLLIHPSLEESFGNTLIEAMARRVPVIGGLNSGAVPWVLDHGNAGVLVDIRSPEKIAEAAMRILTDRETRLKYSEAGYRNAWEKFRLGKMTAEYIKLYEKIIKGKFI